MSIINKINKLLDTKAAIKQAIIDKGVEVNDDTVFADYPSKIAAITSGESGGGGNDSYYENLFLATTSDNTDYSYLFNNCNKPSLDLSRFDTSKVTDMSYMFRNCDATSLDLSHFDTSKVTNMYYMFYGCFYLTSLNISNFNTSNVTTMSNMFSNCQSLTSLDVSSFDTSKVTDMGYMFYRCSSLTSIDVSNFDTSKVTDIGYMFQNCTSLTSLDVSNFDVSKITSNYNVYRAFDGCAALVDLYPPQNINAQLDVSKSTALSHDSLMRIINNLMVKTSTTKLILGATNLAKLSDEEKAIAVNKGWTLA